MAKLTVQQSQHYEGNDWWSWAVWLDGPSDLLDRVRWVEWTLHPTFPQPVRRVEDRQTNFRLDTGGWGVFPIVARVQMQDGTQTKLRHNLELTYPDGTQNTE